MPDEEPERLRGAHMPDTSQRPDGGLGTAPEAGLRGPACPPEHVRNC